MPLRTNTSGGEKGSRCSIPHWESGKGQASDAGSRTALSPSSFHESDFTKHISPDFTSFLIPVISSEKIFNNEGTPPN